MNDTATTLTGGQHGTKLAGALIIATNILSSVDPNVLPPQWATYIGTALGLLTLARGFVNSKNIQAK